jgi:hypothetical protein
MDDNVILLTRPREKKLKLLNSLPINDKLTVTKITKAPDNSGAILFKYG